MSYLPDPERYAGTDYRRCGRSGLLLPPVSLGLWHNFGAESDYENARRLVHGAFDSGITYFDLANNYGPPPGSAEECFGRIFMQDLSRYRDELVIATKAGHLMWEGPYGDWGSRKHMLARLNQQLHVLRMPAVRRGDIDDLHIRVVRQRFIAVVHRRNIVCLCKRFGAFPTAGSNRLHLHIRHLPGGLRKILRDCSGGKDSPSHLVCPFLRRSVQRGTVAADARLADALLPQRRIEQHQHREDLKPPQQHIHRHHDFGEIAERGPATPRPGPMLLNVAATAENVVTRSKPSSATSSTEITNRPIAAMK